MFKKKFSKEQIYRESVILTGPVGVGKSLISSKLGERTGMPVITTDIMRHCPKSISEIKKRKKSFVNRLKELREMLKNANDSKEIDKLEEEIRNIENEIWVCKRRIEMRKLFPNLPNYKEMGFNGEFSNYIRDNFGVVAWHYYQKQFENQLLSAMLEQATVPCIFDMGGGMTISLERDYAVLDKRFREINEELYLKHFNMETTAFIHIENALRPYKNVISLHLPSDYKETITRASRDELNNAFLSTGQYDSISTRQIDTSGLICRESFDSDKLSEILSLIEELRTTENINMK